MTYTYPRTSRYARYARSATTTQAQKEEPERGTSPGEPVLGCDGLDARGSRGLGFTGRLAWLLRSWWFGSLRCARSAGEKKLDGLNGLVPFERGQHFWWQGLSWFGHTRATFEGPMVRLCALTFELTCGRQTAKPAGERQVERRVRRHFGRPF